MALNADALWALYRQIANEKPRVEPELVHPREYFFRVHEQPGASKWDWWQWLRRWHLEVIPADVPGGE